MKILSFGHIPSWAGGRQESGLANVIYQLAKNMSGQDDIQMSMAATDVFVPQREDGRLTIFGWTKGMLIIYALRHPWLSMQWMVIVALAKVKYGGVISVIGYFFKGLHLSHTIDRIKPDAVHLHGMTACVYERIIPRNIPIIVTMHGIIGKDKTIPNQKYLFAMEQDVCRSRRYGMMAFIAEKLIVDFETIYGEIKSPHIVILNAYDAQAFHYIEPKQHEGITLVTIASFSENKGQKRVMEGIAKCGVDYKYICIGAASQVEEQKYKKGAQEMNVKLDYLGKKKPFEIRDILESCDYMILPSSTEGFGLVYLEAIACGVPVILPKHLPIVQENGIIQPEINALLLEDSSTDAIAKLLPELKEYHFDHKKVAESIVGYSWENIAKQYVESFKSLK